MKYSTIFKYINTSKYYMHNKNICSVIKLKDLFTTIFAFLVFLAAIFTTHPAPLLLELLPLLTPTYMHKDSHLCMLMNIDVYKLCLHVHERTCIYIQLLYIHVYACILHLHVNINKNALIHTYK
jgi:hypothetical protein